MAIVAGVCLGWCLGQDWGRVSWLLLVPLSSHSIWGPLRFRLLLPHLLLAPTCTCLPPVPAVCSCASWTHSLLSQFSLAVPPKQVGDRAPEIPGSSVYAHTGHGCIGGWPVSTACPDSSPEKPRLALCFPYCPPGPKPLQPCFVLKERE
jgi:hypothetical protein